MRRSKFLVIALILAIALAGGLQALSLVPHVHGHDVDHSAHSTCPVHQVQSHSIQAVETAAPALLAILVPTGTTELSSANFVCQTFLFQESLRAPPVSF